MKFIRGKGSDHYWSCLLHLVSVCRKKRGHGPYILLDVVTSDGHIVAQKQNSAVSSELLSEILIWSWKMEGATDTDIICRLRHQTVPTGYSYHHWCPGNLAIVVMIILVSL